MDKFFIFIGVMVTVNAVGWIPIFIISAINLGDWEEALIFWHLAMTMIIAIFLSLFVIDPSLFSLMWID